MKDKLLDISLYALLIIATALGGWNLHTTANLGERIRSVETNQEVCPTPEDILEVWKGIAKLQNEITHNEATAPDWILDRLDKIDIKLDKLLSRSSGQNGTTSSSSYDTFGLYPRFSTWFNLDDFRSSSLRNFD